MPVSPELLLEALEPKVQQEIQNLLVTVDERLRTTYSIESNRAVLNLETPSFKTDIIRDVYKSAGWTDEMDYNNRLVFSIPQSRINPFKEKLKRHFTDAVTSTNTPSTVVNPTKPRKADQPSGTRALDI